MEKIKQLKCNLLGKDGLSYPIIVAMVLALLLFFAGIYEYSKTVIIAKGVRDAVQNAVITVSTENYRTVYNGTREGYAGGYTNNGANWIPNVTTGHILRELSQLLSLTQEGTIYAKRNQGELEYSISNLQVDILNTPLAPTENDSDTFQAVTNLDVTIPISFAGKILPPVTLHLKVVSKYILRY